MRFEVISLLKNLYKYSIMYLYILILKEVKAYTDLILIYRNIFI